MSIAALFFITSAQLGLPSGLLSSVCTVETGLNPAAIHRHDGKGNSIGICQIKLKSAQLVGFKGTEKQLMNPKTNIYYAGKLLKHQINRYHGNIAKGVIAYNMGHASVLTATKYQAKVFSIWRMSREYYIAN